MSSTNVSFQNIPNLAIPDYAVPDAAIIGEFYQVRPDPRFISPRLYKDLSDIYADVLSYVTVAEQKVTNAVTRTAQLTNVVAKVDLLRKLRTAENSFKNTGLRASLNNAIITLNSHVEAKSGLSLNDWLESYEIKVKQDWATACIATGYAIDEENIVP